VKDNRIAVSGKHAIHHDGMQMGVESQVIVARTALVEAPKGT